MDRRSTLERVERTERVRRNAEYVWYAVLSLIASAVLFAAVVSSASLVPSFCGGCHAAETSALARSPHEGDHCDACHGSTNAFGLLDRRLGTLRMVAAQITPGTQRITAHSSDDLCLTCHEKDIGETTTRGGIRMSHREVVQAKWSCTSCHQGIAHKAGKSAPVAPNMDQCLECHTLDPKDVEACSQCHVGKRGAESLNRRTTWKVTHGPDWKRAHGLGDLRTCKACHDSSKCAKCHGTEIPHARVFRARHGDLVKADAGAKEQCFTCHRRDSCDSCHGLPMPHPARYLQTHSRLVDATGEDLCYRCHDVSSCVACHTRHTHPGLPEDLREKLRSRPVKAR